MSVMVVLRGGGAGGRSARQLSRGKYLGTSGTQMLILFFEEYISNSLQCLGDVSSGDRKGIQPTKIYTNYHPL